MPNAKVPKGYRDPHLYCRTFGHVWHLGAGEVDGASYYRCILACESCGTRRIDLLNRRTGYLVSRRYEYPENYQSERGEGLARHTYRIEFVRRAIR